MNQASESSNINSVDICLKFIKQELFTSVTDDDLVNVSGADVFHKLCLEILLELLLGEIRGDWTLKNPRYVL